MTFSLLTVELNWITQSMCKADSANLEVSTVFYSYSWK